MDLTTHGDGFDIAVRIVQASEPCAICTNHTAGNMVAFRERPERSIAPLATQTWLLCAECGAAVVAEMERAALRTRLRLRIALGMVAAERRPPQQLTPLDGEYWERLPEERTDKVIIGFVVALFCLVPLIFLLALAITASGVVPH